MSTALEPNQRELEDQRRWRWILQVLLILWFCGGPFLLHAIPGTLSKESMITIGAVMIPTIFGMGIGRMLVYLTVIGVITWQIKVATQWINHQMEEIRQPARLRELHALYAAEAAAADNPNQAADAAAREKVSFLISTAKKAEDAAMARRRAVLADLDSGENSGASLLGHFVQMMSVVGAALKPSRKPKVAKGEGKKAA